MLAENKILLFSIATDQPIWLIVFCLVCAFLFAGGLYYRESRSKELNLKIRYLLFALRFVFSFFLSFFLLGPILKNLSVEYEKPIIIIAQDNSSSIISNSDSSKIKNNFVDDLRTLQSDLNEKYDVRFYTFDSKPDATGLLDFKGKETNIAVLLDEIENNYSNLNVGAVILATDGIYNNGSNPLYQLKKFKFPFYTIALGDTTPIIDIAIKKINHNQIAYLGNKFPAEVVIDAKKLKGKKATLTISKEGKKVSEQAINISSESLTQNINFIFDADKPGVLKYDVAISVMEGERNKTNNYLSFLIEVIDNREKILILANAPHPDIAAIKESIESNNNYEVQALLLKDFKDPIKKYGLVFMHMIPSINSEGAKIYKELIENNIPYFSISNLAGDKSGGVLIKNNQSRLNDVDPNLNTGFSLFKISDDLKNYIRNFPAVKSPLGTYETPNSADVLLSQQIGIVETNNPLLLFFNEGSRKYGAFLGDGLWRWKLRDYADHENHLLFNEIISKIVQYLSVKSDKSYFRLFHKKIMTESESVEFDAEVYNNSYELINDQEVSMIITNKTGSKFAFTFSKVNTSYHLNSGLLPPGDYSYKAMVKQGTILLEKKGSFTISELVSEKINTVADHNLLFQIANKTGGKMYSPSQLANLSKDLNLNDNIKTISSSRKKITDLIELKWIFFLLLGLLSLEWFIRKRNGLY